MKKEKETIILTDGGICSQIAFCVLGKYLEDKGYSVKYDLSWFKENGKDCNGVFERNYVVDKAFPDLNIEIADDETCRKFKKKYSFPCVPNEYLTKIKPKMYLFGYPKERCDYLGRYKDYFKKYFKPAELDSIKDIVDEVENTNSCAVHVRRGDLSRYIEGYGYPAEREYFLKAMEIIKALNEDVVFYFFSEEPDWIRENILPYTKEKCKIIDRNDSSKGHLDLYLVSRCKNIIGSQGSMGIFAKFLNPNENAALVLPYYRDFVFSNLSNVIVLNINPTNELTKQQGANNYRSKIQKYKRYFKITLIVAILFALISITFIILFFMGINI